MYAPLHCAKQQKYIRNLLISDFTSDRTEFSLRKECVQNAYFSIAFTRHRSPSSKATVIVRREKF